MSLLKYLLTIIACSLTFLGYGQAVLTGKVSDKMGTIPGVNVFITNENERVLVGVITDTKGEYYLKMPAGKHLKLNYSFIGYRTKVVDYTGQKVQNIQLEEERIALDEVVVASKMVERNDMGVPYKDQGASTEKITLEAMEGMAVTSVEEMLQGRMANVDLISSSGDPGSGMSIRIRGTSSLSASSEPLIVIDGIPQNMDISDDFDFSTADAEDFGALVSISPADIASIEVLKDAAATAIWGSRGGNGVLVITTKRGSVGKNRFSFSEKVNMNFEPSPIELLDGFQYVSMIQEALWNKAYETNVGNNMANLINPQLVFSPNYVYNKEFNQNTDWVKEITRVAFSSETNFSMSGGGERATYRFSLGYLTETGTTIGTGYNRLNARLNVDYKFSKRLRIAAGLSYSDGDKKAPHTDPRAHAMNKMPNMSPYFMDANGERTGIYFTPESTLQGKWSGVFNPLAMANESFNNNRNRITNLNFTLNYNILTGLRYIGELGINIATNGGESYLPQTVTGVNRLNEEYNKSISTSSEGLGININNKLIFDRRLNESNKIILTALFQTSDRQNSNSKLEANGVSAADLSSPANGAKIKTSAGNSGSREAAAVATFHYNLLDRYMLTANYRYEGNSRMSKAQRWAGFPSVALTWRVSSEPFLKKQNKWLTDLTVRASWGRSGNSPNGSYPYIGKFNVLDNYGDLSAVGPASIHLNGLEWEELTQKNIGLDAELWNAKVRLTFDYYHKLTDNLLQSNVTIPSLTGYDKVAYFNSGKMRNRGWEFRVELNNIVKAGKFSMSANFNLSSNENTVLELPDNINYMNYGDKATNGKYAVTVAEGHPMGAFYGFNYLGVYKDTDATYVRNTAGQLITDMNGNPVKMRHEDAVVSPGDAIYRDVNEDGSINRYDIVYLGNGMPDMTGGFGIILKYGDWRLNTFFNVRIGYDIINEARMKSESMYNYNNQSAAVLRRWRHEGDVTDIPRALNGRGLNWLGSDRFVEDGTFLRMQQLTLTYNLPKNLMSKLRISNASCFVTAYNLFTWTNYSGQDPEVSIKGGVYGGMGYDKALTPRPRRVAFGFKFDF